MEKDIERYLGERVKKLGGLYYKFVSPGNDGVPDRLIVWPNGEVDFVELKTLTGSLSEIQKAQIARLKRRGVFVTVIYGTEDVERYINMSAGCLAEDLNWDYDKDLYDLAGEELHRMGLLKIREVREVYGE